MDFELYESRDELRTKQGVYTFCFVLLCIIDMLMGSATGRVQMVAANCTGLIMGVITLTGYKWKDFFQLPYLIWALAGGFGTYEAIIWGMANKNYKGQWIIAVCVVYLYGFLIIRLLQRFIVERKLPKMNWPLFGGWCVMMLLMMFSGSDRKAPVLLFFCFGAFYLTDFTKEEQNALYKGALHGIIIGFLIVQGFATLFRAYDEVRYNGMYTNSNMNALFYLMVHTAILCKWYQLKKEGKAVGWRIFAAVGSCILIGYGMLTIGRTAILCMILDELVCICLMQLTDKSRRFVFLKLVTRIGAVILISALSLPMVFSLCRYIPAHLYSPMTYFYEQDLWYKIYEPTDFYDTRYVTWEQYLEESFGRFSDLFQSTKKQAEEGVKQVGEALFPTLRVLAAEDISVLEVPGEAKREWGSGESEDSPVLLNKEDRKNPYLVRWAIYRTYLGKLTLFGHSQDEGIVWVTPTYNAPHAHNVFLQMLFSYGIPAGILFLADALVLIGCSLVALFRRRETWNSILPFLFGMAFVGFGLFEINWGLGQLSLFLFFFIQYAFLHSTKYSND